jgi:hypothetical protein
VVGLDFLGVGEGFEDFVGAGDDDVAGVEADLMTVWVRSEAPMVTGVTTASPLM